ncbi:hypothetical protein [Streptomyces olivaceiscleroticus]|uniref:Uncharacterized protein n=1 Tax=Streptomyces olivaceiscleroticus TaxID=68245 RepID=A0ABP3LMU2_9ACTN
MNDDRLTQIKGDLSAATKGPWVADGRVVKAEDGRVIGVFDGTKWSGADARLATRARIDVEWLVEQLEQARDIAVGLENENARLAEALATIKGAGQETP